MGLWERGQQRLPQYVLVTAWTEWQLELQAPGTPQEGSLLGGQRGRRPV